MVQTRDFRFDITFEGPTEVRFPRRALSPAWSPRAYQVFAGRPGPYFTVFHASERLKSAALPRNITPFPCSAGSATPKDDRGAKTMLRPSASVLITVLACCVCATAADHHIWHTGKVLDSRLATAHVADGATTNTYGSATANSFGNTATASGNATSTTSVSFANIQDNQLVILGEGFAYIVEDTRVSGGSHLLAHAWANRHHGCRFIVGDDVRYWQDKAVLHVLDADAKECKVDVLRQERLK